MVDGGQRGRSGDSRLHADTDGWQKPVSALQRKGLDPAVLAAFVSGNPCIANLVSRPEQQSRMSWLATSRHSHPRLLIHADFVAPHFRC